MSTFFMRKLQFIDHFRVLINERPSELCLIDHNSEEVHNLQSPNEKKYWCYYPHWSRDSVFPVCVHLVLQDQNITASFCQLKLI